MPEPNPAVIAAIRGRVVDWTPTNAQIAATLNTANIANPTARLNVPKPMTTAALLGLIVNANKAKVYGRAVLSDLRGDIRAGDRTGVKSWFGLALVAADITSAEYTALVAEVDAVVPDPSWPAQVSWAQLNIGRPLDASDIAASRPGV